MGGASTETHLLRYMIHQWPNLKPETDRALSIGKILVDGHTVESYNIEEKGFIVCMYSKVRSSGQMDYIRRAGLTPVQPKAAPAGSSTSGKAPSTPVATAAQTPAPPAAPAQTSSTTTNAPATPSPAPAGPTAPTSTEAATFNDPSALTLGPQREAAIQNMESMGFPRDEIDRAMRAAYFNPDRAVEYLLNACFCLTKLQLSSH